MSGFSRTLLAAGAAALLATAVAAPKKPKASVPPAALCSRQSAPPLSPKEHTRAFSSRSLLRWVEWERGVLGTLRRAGAFAPR